VIDSIRRIGDRRGRLRPSSGRDAAARRDITPLPLNSRLPETIERCRLRRSDRLPSTLLIPILPTQI